MSSDHEGQGSFFPLEVRFSPNTKNVLKPFIVTNFEILLGSAFVYGNNRTLYTWANVMSACPFGRAAKARPNQLNILLPGFQP